MSLEALAERFEIPLVVTQPDRRKGRGRKVLPTPVRRRAEELGLPVLPAQDVNSGEVVERIKAAAGDVLAVVSFGQVLKKAVLDVPPLGCLNLHFSLLPELRGAAPVPRAIMRGLSRTGVSVARMITKMDAGPVYAREEEPIRADDTAGDLYRRLAARGARLFTETLAAVAEGSVTPHRQDESRVTCAPRITRGDSAVDWTRPAVEIDRQIRGLSGQLAVFAYFHGERETRVNFYRSRPAEGESPGPGVAVRSPGGGLLAGCGEGLVEILEIQAEGRGRRSGREFANGYHIKGGERFGGPSLPA
jgi:methionyl-tRNA formyltransferase